MCAGVHQLSTMLISICAACCTPLPVCIPFTLRSHRAVNKCRVIILILMPFDSLGCSMIVKRGCWGGGVQRERYLPRITFGGAGSYLWYWGMDITSVRGGLSHRVWEGYNTYSSEEGYFMWRGVGYYTWQGRDIIHGGGWAEFITKSSGGNTLVRSNCLWLGGQSNMGEVNYTKRCRNMLQA
jgi:hypothetical protein